MEKYVVGADVTLDILEGVESVSIESTSK